MEHDETPGMDRRDLLKRGAVVGGALVWTAPLVQTIASPAFAATSPGGQEVCPDGTGTRTTLFRVEGGPGNFLFTSPTGGNCQQLPASQTSAVNTIVGLTATFTGQTAVITVPAGFALVDQLIKASNDCLTGRDVTVRSVAGPAGSTIYTLTIGGDHDISNVNFVIAPCV